MTITRAQTPRLSRGDRLKLKTNTVIAALRKGEALILKHRWCGRCWTLSGGRPVDDEIAKLVVKNRNVVGVGDSLFKNTPSQTWRWIED